VSFVLAASSDPFSAQHTRVILMKIWLWVNGTVDLRTFNHVHLLIRKSAHVTEYGILSALCFRAVRGRIHGVWHARWMLPAIIAPLLVAITDEVHQAFVPSRGSSGWDVMIDLGGACVAQLAIWAVLRRKTVSSFDPLASSHHEHSKLETRT
jgi:VanZ family protein